MTTTRQGNRRTRTTPHKERMRGLVKPRDYPPHSYIVNERYNSRKKGQAKRKNSECQEPVTSPAPNTNPGRSRNRWNFPLVGYLVATSHFAATPQSDIVRICAHDFRRHGDAFGTTENACFRAFITLRSQFRLHHCSQRTLTEIVSKIIPNLSEW